MAIKPDREYRTMPMAMEAIANDEEKESFVVEGYASTFQPYTLYTDENGTDYKEVIDRNAYDGADMTDVLFLYNHEGQVMARQKNGSLQLSVDDGGLKVRADLGGSRRGREMYEEIKSGLIDQMSFAFTVEADGYDRKSHTRTIKSFRKLYDVSAVSIPANPTTAISARSWVDGVIAQEEAERLREQEAEQEKRELQKQIERLMSFRKEANTDECK